MDTYVPQNISTIPAKNVTISTIPDHGELASGIF